MAMISLTIIKGEHFNNDAVINIDDYQVSLKIYSHGKKLIESNAEFDDQLHSIFSMIHLVLKKIYSRSPMLREDDNPSVIISSKTSNFDKDNINCNPQEKDFEIITILIPMIINFIKQVMINREQAIDDLKEKFKTFSDKYREFEINYGKDS